MSGTMVITIDAEPYRYEQAIYEATLTGGGSNLSGTVENLRMPAAPKVTVSSACQLFFGGKVYELAAGEDLDVPGLVFGPYENEVSVTGTSSITFRFRRGCL